MIKARFYKAQPPVNVVNMDGILYIYICLNGRICENEESWNSEGEKETYYEYDYQELVKKEGEIDLDDLDKYPEKYVTLTESE